MKHADYFNNFLTNTVNLSKLKLNQSDDRVDDVYDDLRADTEFGGILLGKKMQGSRAQRTIIEPVRGREFDADVMLRMRYNPAWENNPREYPNALYNALDRVIAGREFERKCRCVRVHYIGMHIDFVPYVEHADGYEAIINRDENEFERTDPAEFTRWMRDKDDVANKNLRKVIRLLKYLRDHKNSFTGTRSIILTTLLGEQVDRSKKLWTPGIYDDVPTTLLNLVTDLDAWLQQQDDQPHLADPSGTGLDFDERWKPESFAYFKDRLHVHAAEIHDAYHEKNFDESVKRWQALFGEAFDAPKPSSPSKFGSTGGAVTTGRAG